MPFPVAVLDTQDSARSLALQVGYYGYSETGELLSLQAKHISVSETADLAILALGLTKTSQQVGSADSVTVRVTHVCSKLQCWKSKPSLPFLSTSGNSSHLLERRLAHLATVAFDVFKPPLRAFFLTHQARLRRGRSAIFGGRG